ncbi:hypothetical protein BC835DRAFT_1029470 [Cytidiella melzeri]|nr:hypothetical protein BC835DRAFT_1029470 [Cytidiella melzeri]
MKDRCQLIWKGASSLFPPHPCRRRARLAQEMQETLEKTISFAATVDELILQHSAISKHDVDKIGCVMPHPPHPRIYDMDKLIGSEAWISMDLLPWRLTHCSGWLLWKTVGVLTLRSG